MNHVETKAQPSKLQRRHIFSQTVELRNRSLEQRHGLRSKQNQLFNFYLVKKTTHVSAVNHRQWFLKSYSAVYVFLMVGSLSLCCGVSYYVTDFSNTKLLFGSGTKLIIGSGKMFSCFLEDSWSKTCSTAFSRSFCTIVFIPEISHREHLVVLIWGGFSCVEPQSFCRCLSYCVSGFSNTKLLFGSGTKLIVESSKLLNTLIECNSVNSFLKLFNRNVHSSSWTNKNH